MPSQASPQSESVTLASSREGIPDLRLLHYNDVYHIEYYYQPELLGACSKLTAMIPGLALLSPLVEYLVSSQSSTITDQTVGIKGSPP